MVPRHGIKRHFVFKLIQRQIEIILLPVFEAVIYQISCVQHGSNGLGFDPLGNICAGSLQCFRIGIGKSLSISHQHQRKGRGRVCGCRQRGRE